MDVKLVSFSSVDKHTWECSLQCGINILHMCRLQNSSLSVYGAPEQCCRSCCPVLTVCCLACCLSAPLQSLLRPRSYCTGCLSGPGSGPVIRQCRGCGPDLLTGHQPGWFICCSSCGTGICTGRWRGGFEEAVQPVNDYTDGAVHALYRLCIQLRLCWWATPSCSLVSFRCSYPVSCCYRRVTLML